MWGERESEDGYGEEMKVKRRGGGLVRVLGFWAERGRRREMGRGARDHVHCTCLP